MESWLKALLGCGGLCCVGLITWLVLTIGLAVDSGNDRDTACHKDCAGVRWSPSGKNSDGVQREWDKSNVTECWAKDESTQPEGEPEDVCPDKPLGTDRIKAKSWARADNFDNTGDSCPGFVTIPSVAGGAKCNDCTQFALSGYPCGDEYNSTEALTNGMWKDLWASENSTHFIHPCEQDGCSDEWCFVDADGVKQSLTLKGMWKKHYNWLDTAGDDMKPDPDDDFIDRTGDYWARVPYGTRNWHDSKGFADDAAIKAVVVKPFDHSDGDGLGLGSGADDSATWQEILLAEDLGGDNLNDQKKRQLKLRNDLCGKKHTPPVTPSTPAVTSSLAEEVQRPANIL